jgi:hypothetical protein
MSRGNSDCMDRFLLFREVVSNTFFACLAHSKTGGIPGTWAATVDWGGKSYRREGHVGSGNRLEWRIECAGKQNPLWMKCELEDVRPGFRFGYSRPSPDLWQDRRSIGYVAESLPDKFHGLAQIFTQFAYRGVPLIPVPLGSSQHHLA